MTDVPLSKERTTVFYVQSVMLDWVEGVGWFRPVTADDITEALKPYGALLDRKQIIEAMTGGQP